MTSDEYISSSSHSKMAVISRTTLSNYLFIYSFFEWEFFFIYLSFTELCPKGFNLQQVSTGLGSGLSSIRRQAINWTKADSAHWLIYVVLGWWVKCTNHHFSRSVCWFLVWHCSPWKCFASTKAPLRLYSCIRDHSSRSSSYKRQFSIILSKWWQL